MKGFLQTFLVPAAVLIAGYPVYAQAVFTSMPADTIVAEVPIGTGRMLTFQQHAVSGDSLRLSWRRIAVSLPREWQANLCDNGTCYPDLPDSGSMYPVPAGGYGQMALDIKPLVTPGTATIRYSVWDERAPGERDTLTWIVQGIAASVVGKVGGSSIVTYSVNKMIYIKGSYYPGQEILLFDVTGKLVFRRMRSGQEDVLDLSALSVGLYVLVVNMRDHYVTSMLQLKTGQ